MELSMATCYFYDATPEDALMHSAAVGCRYVELSTEHSEELVARGNLQKTGRMFRLRADELGVGIPQGHLFLTVNITDDDQAGVTNLLKSWLELYLSIGIKSAVLHPGGRNMLKAGCDLKSINWRRASVLNILKDFIKGTDLTICLENIDGTLAYADELLELIELAGPDNLGICLDTGHLNISKGEQGEFIHKAGKYLKALHIHDNDGSADQHILPYSYGNIDWTQAAAALKSIGYKGVVNYEIPMESHAPMAVRYAKFEYIKKLHDIIFKN
jgi:sugar phosphate isomerase/epimerase